MKMLLLNTKPAMKKMLKTSNFVRRFLFAIGNHRYFEVIILICIILNTLVLTIHWYEMPDTVANAVTFLNYTFAYIFTIEAIIKIVA
mmetsp:Transcript_3694/g.3629  ORF Transcript_3694/g.3629 Transcript_3694/m.3629 type:complete len:87 (+) Transcript_3694:149-409(+)